MDSYGTMFAKSPVPQADLRPNMLGLLPACYNLPEPLRLNLMRQLSRDHQTKPQHVTSRSTYSDLQRLTVTYSDLQFWFEVKCQTLLRFGPFLVLFFSFFVHNFRESQEALLQTDHWPQVAPRLVGGFNPSEKYQSIGMIIPNTWKNKKMFQTTDQKKNK